VAPSSVQQLQCYCNATFCGAGMLDAGAAVTAVSGLAARIDPLSTAVAGQSLQLSSSGSSSASGRSIVAWTWTLVSGGGVVTGFTSATNAATAALTPTAAGSFSVRLTVTDDLGLSAGVDQTISVAAAAVITPTPAPTPPATGSSGGGAMSAPWLLLLAAAVLALRRSGLTASVSAAPRKA